MTTKGPKRAKGKASATRATPGRNAKPSKAGPDNWVLGVVNRHPNLLVPHFLVHSYLEYPSRVPGVAVRMLEELGGGGSASSGKA
jgi:hypothetical protein